MESNEIIDDLGLSLNGVIFVIILFILLRMVFK